MPKSPDSMPLGRAGAVDEHGARGVSGQFLVEMSRELRADLGALTKYLELLRRKLDQPDQQELAGAALAAAQQVTITLNSSVDYARAIGGHVKVKPASFNVRQLIHEVVGVMGVEARQRDVRIGTHLHPDLPRRLRGDRRLVGECLAHVLHNAVSFGRTGVDFNISYFDGTLTALVEDDGPGVPDALAEQLFQPFETLHDNEMSGSRGPGLGLAVTRAFTNLLGGSVRFIPRRAHGACVELRWPLEVALSWTSGVEASDSERTPPISGEEVLPLDDFDPDIAGSPPRSGTPSSRKPRSNTRSIHPLVGGEAIATSEAVVPDNVAALRQRYTSTFATLHRDLDRLLSGTLEGSAEDIEGLRCALHRMAGTADDLQLAALADKASSACTTVRALQRAYPNPAELPPDSQKVLRRAITKVQALLVPVNAETG